MALPPESIALPHQPLRFIHASDLHLERGIEGVTECPARWEQRMLDISIRSAERLFKRCIEEEIDFLVLSGGVFNANLASPGIYLFLVDQFERLKNVGIKVYWAGGEFDSPEDWATTFSLPENVYRFPSDTIQEYFFHRSNGAELYPVTKLIGMSRSQCRKRIRSSEFPQELGSLFTIAVANGEIEPETLAQRYIDYWAMGGIGRQHTFYGNPRKKGPDGNPVSWEPEYRFHVKNKVKEKKDLPPLPFIVHYPGASLARTPQDIGMYGATLVEVPLNASGFPSNEPILTPFSTSPIRWVHDRILLESGDDAGTLIQELRLRIKNYRDAQKAEDLLINWFIDIQPGHLAQQLRSGGLTQDVLSELRAMYGQDEPMTWSVSLSVISPEHLPKTHYEQQTILGDFLRSIKHFQDHPQEFIHLDGYIPKNWEHPETAKQLLLAEKVRDEITGSEDQLPKEHWVQSSHQTEVQQQVLRDAAMAGLELFTQNVKDLTQ